MKNLKKTLLAGALAAAALPTAFAQAGPAAPDVPSTIDPGAGHKVFLVGHAEGTQIYRCTAGSWGFVAPDAKLYGDNGKQITTHGAGPHWTATDGSSVIGARVDGVPKAGTIPWLLLSAKPAPGSPEDGRLSATTFIQRVNTTGGVSPAAGTCTAVNEGEVRAIPYTADYYFWKATGA